MIEQNTGAINVPGTYKDPVSGASLEVSMESGADALVRLGWALQEDAAVEAVAKEEVVAEVEVEEAQTKDAPVVAEAPVAPAADAKK